jgi:hypothetical protein
MTTGVVVVYFSQLGGRLRTHQEVMLAADAKAIAGIKGYEFGGCYQEDHSYSGPLFFVPDDTLLLDEALGLGIRGPADLYGGVVRYPFVKTKAITHPLVGSDAVRPEGWSNAFPERVRNIVLPGYTAFSPRDARIAAARMLAQSPIRIKRPLGSEGKGQTVIASIEELDPVLEDLSEEDVTTYGVVIEEDLQKVVTRSVGRIDFDGFTMTYHGKQRLTTDNQGRSVYGGSDLICVRGDWETLDRLPLADEERIAINQAKAYDDAMGSYPGFMASRKNYDIAEGIGNDGQRHCGVLESSWRVGGATGAEVLAITQFLRDPSLQVIEAVHVEEFGDGRAPPEHAVVHFQGEDPRLGPVLRYTMVKQ